MPRPPNLDNCTIYHIREIESRRVAYVGATTAFTKRKCLHKSTCNNVSDSRYNLPIYAYIREIGGWHLFEMIPVLHFTCGNIMELHIAEQQEIDKHTGLFNARYAVRSKAQYEADNRDKIAEYKKQYYVDNKDVIADYNKQYYVDNKDKINEYRADNKDKINEYSKQRYADNKDSINERMRQYKIKNKDALAAKAAAKITCECGCIMSKNGIAVHRKSAKHKKLLEQLNYEPIALLAIAHDVYN